MTPDFIFDCILTHLPYVPEGGSSARNFNHSKAYNFNDEEILVGTEEEACVVADILDALGYTAITGQYEECPGTGDELTGLWYVTIQ